MIHEKNEMLENNTNELKELALLTTAHGIPRIAAARGRCGRLSWSIVTKYGLSLIPVICGLVA